MAFKIDLGSAGTEFSRNVTQPISDALGAWLSSPVQGGAYGIPAGNLPEVYSKVTVPDRTNPTVGINLSDLLTGNMLPLTAGLYAAGAGNAPGTVPNAPVMVAAVPPMPMPQAGTGSQSSGGATKQGAGVKTSGTKGGGGWPTAPQVPFVVPQVDYTSGVMSNALQNIGEPPKADQNLAEYLKGNSLAQAVTPPQMQGFGMPVLGLGDTFGLTPEMYNSMLDTTKGNVAFNNQVTQNNFNNQMTAIKTLQEADRMKTQEWKDLVQSRNSFLQGEEAAKRTAYMESPAEQDSRKFQSQAAMAEFEGKVHRALAQEKFAHDTKLQAMKSAKDKELLDSTYRKEAIKKLMDLGGDVIKKALTGLTSNDLKAYNAALSSGDQASAMSILESIKVQDPVSQANLDAARRLLPVFSAGTGLPVSELLGGVIPGANAAKAEASGKTFKSVEEYRKSLKK